MLGLRGGLEASGGPRPEAHGPHPLSDSPPTHPPALGLQIQRDPGRAITAPVRVKEPLNVSVQTPVFGRPG